MTDEDRLVHLGGYAAIVAVLGSASWAGLAGTLLGAGFVIAALLLFGWELFDLLKRRLRAEAEAAAEVSADD